MREIDVATLEFAKMIRQGGMSVERHPQDDRDAGLSRQLTTGGRTGRRRAARRQLFSGTQISSPPLPLRGSKRSS